MPGNDAGARHHAHQQWALRGLHITTTTSVVLQLHRLEGKAVCGSVKVCVHSDNLPLFTISAHLSNEQ